MARIDVPSADRPWSDHMPWLHETFAEPLIDPCLRWHNPPADWSPGRDGLLVRTAAATNFWQGTHYGFRVDNGHLFVAEVEGDFLMETEVRSAPVNQYDQAGLMVRVDAGCWLKTAVEFEPEGPSRLGAVVTNAGWSDWSTQDVEPEAGRHASFRVTLKGGDVLVEARLGGEGSWSQIRLARLHALGSGPLLAGLYACSPKEAGLAATFKHLLIEQR
jgi:regulation of enolase protein 1 (concanavalin A-like superfamily)